MSGRRTLALIWCAVVVILLGSAVWLAETRANPVAPDATSFEDLLGNPLQPRDHSHRIDRLDLIDSTTAFRAGTADHVLVINEKVPRIVLASDDQLGFPRRGAWVGPEQPTEFPFSELVPSWNATTPHDTGVFFQLRTRDAKSREWSPWLLVGRWGRTVHARPGDRLPNDRVTRFPHGAIRIDMPLILLSQPADAYQIRMTLQSFDLDPSVTPAVRRVAVAYSGTISDPAERTRLMRPASPGDRWARSLPVPHVAQDSAPPTLRSSVCMPACETMVLAYWKVKRTLIENALATYDPDTGMFGNGALAVARAADLGLDGWVQRVQNWDEVKAFISRGRPVIASIQASPGASHLIVIRGFTKDGNVLVNDPAESINRESTRNAAELGRKWFDCGGFACVLFRPTAN